MFPERNILQTLKYMFLFNFIIQFLWHLFTDVSSCYMTLMFGIIFTAVSISGFSNRLLPVLKAKYFYLVFNAVFYFQLSKHLFKHLFPIGLCGSQWSKGDECQTSPYHHFSAKPLIFAVGFLFSCSPMMWRWISLCFDKLFLLCLLSLLSAVVFIQKHVI